MPGYYETWEDQRTRVAAQLAAEQKRFGLRNVFGYLVEEGKRTDRGLGYHLPKLGSVERPHGHKNKNRIHF